VCEQRLRRDLPHAARHAGPRYHQSVRHHRATDHSNSRYRTTCYGTVRPATDGATDHDAAADDTSASGHDAPASSPRDGSAENDSAPAANNHRAASPHDD
jgi:hypothetical protein